MAVKIPRTAATRRSPTAPVPSDDPSVLLSLGLPLATEGAITPIRGGLPILVEGQVVGGIGVSSGTEEQDVDCAQAGVCLPVRPKGGPPQKPGAASLLFLFFYE